MGGRSRGAARRILALGIRDVRPEWHVASDAKTLAAMIRTESDGAIVVLGDEGLVHLQPKALARLVRKKHDVVLCPVACPRERLVAWGAARFTTVTDEDRLATSIEACIREERRLADIPIADWIHVAPGSAAEEAVRVVRDLPIAHSVNGWAAALGWDRRLLWDVCKADQNLTPGQVLGLHVCAQVRHLRARGLTVADIARRLGYKSAASLCNAYARRGWRMPPRGGHDD